MAALETVPDGDEGRFEASLARIADEIARCVAAMPGHRVAVEAWEEPGRSGNQQIGMQLDGRHRWLEFSREFLTDQDVAGERTKIDRAVRGFAKRGYCRARITRDGLEFLE